MTRKTIVIIVLLGLLIAAVADLRINEFEGLIDFFALTEPKSESAERRISASTPRVVRTEEKEYDAKGLDQFTLLNPNGSIWISGTGEDQIKVRVTYTAYGETREKVDSYLESLSLKDSRSGSKVQLSLNRSGKLPDEVYAIKADYVITAPASLTLNLEGQGTVQVENFQGFVEVKNLFGQVVVQKTGAGVKVIQNSGPAKIIDVKGDVDLHTSFGAVDVRQVGGNFTFNSNSGQVFFEDIQGSVTGENSFGKTTGYRIGGDVTLNNRMGAVDLTEPAGSIKLSNQFGDILVHDFKKNADVTVKQGQVRLYGAVDNHRILAETKYGNIDIPDWPGMKVETKGSSEYRFEGTTGEGKYEMKLKGDFGSIVIIETDSK